MSITMKKITLIPAIVRNLRLLRNYPATKRYVGTSSCCLSEDHSREDPITRKDLEAQYYDMSQGIVLKSNLKEKLKNSGSTNQVLSIVREQRGNLTIDQAIEALRTLSKILERNPLQTKVIRERAEFFLLCEILKKNLMGASINQCLLIMSTFIRLGIPSSSNIIQYILQIFTQSINDLTFKQIINLDYLLNKCETTPISAALKIALPIVCETTLISKLNTENIHDISSAFRYLGHSSKNQEIFHFLLHILNGHMQNLSAKDAYVIFNSIVFWQCYDHLAPEIIKSLLDNLSPNINDFPYSHKTHVLKNITFKVRKGVEYFYHEGFVDAYISNILSENPSVSQAIFIIYHLNVMSHVNTTILDYVAGKIYEDATVIESFTEQDIETFIRACATADFKPIFWDAIIDPLMTKGFSVIEKPPIALIFNLLCLDCYCPEIISKVFDGFINKGWRSNWFLPFYRIVTALYPQYDGPLPTFINFKSWNNVDFPLVPYLETALGGSQYVLTNLQTKLGNLISHLIVMRKGGYPIAFNEHEFNEKTIFVEDIKSPADSQVILILYLPAIAYARNTQRMRGTWTAEIKVIEATTGRTTIPISKVMFERLSEKEKINYLMQAIKLRCDEKAMSTNA